MVVRRRHEEVVMECEVVVAALRPPETCAYKVWRAALGCNPKGKKGQGGQKHPTCSESSRINEYRGQAEGEVAGYSQQYEIAQVIERRVEQEVREDAQVEVGNDCLGGGETTTDDDGGLWGLQSTGEGRHDKTRPPSSSMYRYGTATRGKK